MPRVIAFDLARLFLGPLFLAPRGIDRVDLALARHVFPDVDSPNLGILPTFWGLRVYRAPQVLRLLAHVQQLWAEDAPGNTDPVQHERFLRIVEEIRTPGAARREAIPAPRNLTLRNKVVRMVQELYATGMPVGRAVRRHVPERAVYLNVGQLGLAVPMFFEWLHDRPDITCAMMLHDVIPLEYPDLVRPGQVVHHARMVRTAARHADCMIFTTDYARDTVNAALAHHGRPHLPSLVRGLPLSEAFAQTRSSLPDLAGKRYFVVVSTIEPRKNHNLLLRVWERLIARLSNAAPHLVIVGARGYDAARILAPLKHAPLLRAHVHEVAGLSSHDLAALMLGATGVLSPTWVEGFGLPVLEANTMGVPTIASDIAAHREIAKPGSILLSCDDDDAWERAIMALPTLGLRMRPTVPPDATEAAYCTDILAFLKHETERQSRPAVPTSA